MIPRLASPTICVIDDEEDEYRPILSALLRMGLGCVHVEGTSIETLPAKPFNGLRVVFTDLHLAGNVGKSAASHTANVFAKVVPMNGSPILAVIWSKYKDEPVEDDQEKTEAALFKHELLTSFPQFKERLVFLEMPKPKPDARPDGSEWISVLEKQIQNELSKIESFDVLWGWEAIVRDAGMQVTEALTNLALLPGNDPDQPLEKKLGTALRMLVREQGGPGCLAETAPRHLASILAQSLIDHLEHLGRLDLIQKHGVWLADQNGLPETTSMAPGINGFLLTAATSGDKTPFCPGTVYSLDPESFEKAFGATVAELVRSSCCYQDKSAKQDQWLKHTTIPIAVELSPVCDVAQETRRNAMLLGGLVLPSAARSGTKRAESIELLPTITLRSAVPGFAAQDAFAVLFSRLKATLPAKNEPPWLKPWFRLRELPTASLRNWHSSHAARVGYVSLRAG